jgi:hypothetical protein
MVPSRAARLARLCRVVPVASIAQARKDGVNEIHANEIKVFLVCFSLLLGTWALIVWVWLFWLLLGLLVVYGLFRAWLAWRRNVAADRMIQAEASKEEAIAALHWEAVETAKVQRSMIPDTMIGILLERPEQRANVMVWPRTVTHNYGQLAQPETPLLDAPTVAALPFRSMYQEIGPDRFVFGYRQDGTPVYGAQRKLGSGCLVVGRPDMGKSSLARYWLAMALAAKIPTIMLDPHGSIAEEVGELLECCQSVTEIRAAARQVLALVDARLANMKAQHQPLLVLVDEWRWHVKNSPESTEAVARVIMEGRKLRMSAMLFGHSYSAEGIGRDVFDNTTSQYVFWTSSLQARMAGLEMTEANKALLGTLRTAGPGKTILSLPGDAPEVVSISETTVQDIAMMIDLYGVPAVRDRVCVEEEPAKTAQNSTESITHTHKVTAAQRAEILRLHHAGEKPSVIAGAVLGDNHKGLIVRSVVQEEEN